jgi:transposase
VAYEKRPNGSIVLHAAALARRRAEAHAAVLGVPAVLGASNYTDAEATYAQQVRDFIESHVRALAFFGPLCQESCRLPRL